MKGRKPKPTALKLVTGNPGHRPLNKNEPQPEHELPPPPEHLAPAAMVEWGRISEQLYRLGLLTGVDRAQLAAYCQAYARWKEAEEGIKKVGLVIKTTNGNVIQNPLVGIANTALLLMHKFAVEFGLTPSSRSRISVKKTSDQQSPWEKFGAK